MRHTATMAMALGVVLLAGCASGPAQCAVADMDVVSWVHPGYSESVWHLLQIPPPGVTDWAHDPGLGPDGYVLEWGDRGGPWDVPLTLYPIGGRQTVTNTTAPWTFIPNATYRSLDGPWDIRFGRETSTVRFTTERQVATDGSLINEMRHVIRSITPANQSVQDAAFDDAVRNATRSTYMIQVPGPPRIGHLWNEHGVTWELTPEQDLYWVHAGPWTFAVDVNGIDVDRRRGPDHHVDLHDRVYADPAGLDPDNFPRLEEEPETIEEVLHWFRVLAVMPEAPQTEVLVQAPPACALPAGVGRLPAPA